MNRKVYGAVCACALGMGVLVFGANAIHANHKVKPLINENAQAKVKSGVESAKTLSEFDFALSTNTLLVQWENNLPFLTKEQLNEKKLIIPENMGIDNKVVQQNNDWFDAQNVPNGIDTYSEAGVGSGQGNNTDTVETVTQGSMLSNRDLAKQRLEISNPQFAVSAKAALLMNSDTKEILYKKDALSQIAPASTTKLMTAMTALDHCNLNEKIKVGDEVGLIASDSSKAHLQKGQVLTMEQCLDAMLLPSGNDAAYVVATHIGRKIANDDTLKAKAAVKVFIGAMNEKVEELGLVDTHFESPDGYDAEGQHTTAYDMGLIGAAALDYDAIRATVKKPQAQDKLVSGETMTWNNTNKLIRKGSGYYYSHTIGLKTGTSGQAGKCLVSAIRIDGKEYISVVMNASMSGRWQDSVDLFRYVVDQMK